MQIIYGDITDVERGIILHQVNCQSKMGAGIAKVISDKWHEVKKQYHQFCYMKRPSELLGQWQMVSINPSLYVVNVFGQLSLGRDKGRCYTDYDALSYALNDFRDYYHNPAIEGLPLFYPKMGCKLGGADWNKVSTIIENAFSGLEHYLVEN